MKTEGMYGILIAVAAGLCGYFFAPGRELALLDQAVLKVASVALFMAFSVGFLFVLRGTKYNVLASIFDEKNVAGAIFSGLFLVAVALCFIGK